MNSKGLFLFKKQDKVLLKKAVLNFLNLKNFIVILEKNQNENLNIYC